jgi:CO/xanthine dehydrogenase Mo-binding subunit
MSQFEVVGKSVPTKDAWEKANGRARYAVDITRPGMLMGKILRSPYPHARIVHIDVSRAEKLRGVKAVIAGSRMEAQRGEFDFVTARSS